MIDSNNTSVALTLEEMDQRFNLLTKDLNDFFLIIMGCIVYLMQCGFALLEAGAVRSKNTTNILLKNVLDAFIGAVAYGVFGWAFAYGADLDGGSSNSFIGYHNFAMSDMDGKYAEWFFQYVFAATAATIVSGSLAERCDFSAYLIYSFVISGMVYPVSSHWAWDSKGWLTTGIEWGEDGTIAYQDFAGSGVVHLVGGTLALMAAIMIGPRIGRFNSMGELRPIRGHSVPLAALGGFILFFGFLAFNGGSQLAITNPGDGQQVALAICNTILSGSGAALSSITIKYLLGWYNKSGKQWSLLSTINGALVGMVSICAGCNAVRPWCAFLIGIISAFFFFFTNSVLIKYKIDDPLDAVAVHGGGGIWGVLAVPIFKTAGGFIYTGSVLSLKHFTWNLVGVLVYGSWGIAWGFIIFGSLRYFKILRVHPDIEKKGLDIIKHDEPAYPSGNLTYATDLKNLLRPEDSFTNMEEALAHVESDIRTEKNLRASKSRRNENDDELDDIDVGIQHLRDRRAPNSYAKQNPIGTENKMYVPVHEDEGKNNV